MDLTAHTDLRPWDAVIVGGGAAGLSAAQMLGRARRRVLVVDAGEPRNRFAAHMHGVLGHDGADPRELLARGRDEARRYGVEIAATRVASIRDEGGTLRVERADGAVEHTRAVILAPGIRDELPAVPGLAERWGRDVLHCPYCHGFEVAGRALGVLATSAQSLHQLELVRQWSAEVTAFTAAVDPLPDDVRARLTARGVRIIATPVREVVVADAATGTTGTTGTTDRIVGIRTVDGVVHAVDALFCAPDPVIDLGFADGLGLARTDLPGSPLAVDALGATTHPRVWGAGNVVAPYANVPVAMAAGSMAGAAVNAALVAEDARAAVADRARVRDAAWEERYAASDRVWSGRVNATFAAIAEGFAPGTALDLGCGEGGDAVWLAERDWRVVGVDVSGTAVERARTAARARGLADRVEFTTDAVDVAAPGRTFDLVTSSFLHSWESDFPRISLLRRAAERVAPGGHLLVVSHAAPPPWSHDGGADDDHAPHLRTPAEELPLLGLDPAEWIPEIVEVRTREAHDPDGAPVSLDDGVLLLRRVPRGAAEPAREG